MTIKEKIGQMIMAGFDYTHISDETMALLSDYKIGNIILFSRNIDSKEQTQLLCYDLHNIIERNTGQLAFIAIDQEGGVVTRLSEDATNIPGAMLIGTCGDENASKVAGEITGAELHALGINFNLAPVADVNNNEDNTVIGVRSYSSDPHIVARHATNMFKGLEHQNVMACAKHFPGHGDTAVDSHLGLPIIQKTYEELEKVELIPFIELIKNNVPAIMSAHILFPSIEAENIPATMSKTILTGILREKLQYKGLILTDCMEMNAIKEFYGSADGAVKAINAGAEIICVSHSEETIIEVAQKIEKAVEKGIIPIETIDKAVKHILLYKQLYKVDGTIRDNLDSVGSIKHKDVIKKIYEKGIKQITKQKLPQIDAKTVFVGSYPYRSTIASSIVKDDLHFGQYMANRFERNYIDVPINPTEDEIRDILEQVKGYSTVIYGLYNGHLNRGQINLANAFYKKNKKVVAITLRNPYDMDLLEDGINKIVGYEYNRAVFEVVIKFFTEGAEHGKIPSN